MATASLRPARVAAPTFTGSWSEWTTIGSGAGDLDNTDPDSLGNVNGIRLTHSGSAFISPKDVTFLMNLNGSDAPFKATVPSDLYVVTAATLRQNYLKSGWVDDNVTMWLDLWRDGSLTQQMVRADHPNENSNEAFGTARDWTTVMSQWGLASTKYDWEMAYLEWRMAKTNSMSGDSIFFELYDAELNITYTPIPTDSPYIVDQTSGTLSGTAPNIICRYAPLEGDVILVFVADRKVGYPDDVAIPSSAAVWNPLISSPYVLRGDDSPWTQMSVWWHVVTAAEAASSVSTWTMTGLYAASTSIYWSATVWRGSDPVNPISSYATHAGITPSTTHTLAGITPSVTNGTFIHGYMYENVNDITLQSSWDATGHTKRGGGSTGVIQYERNTRTTSGVAIAATNISVGSSYGWLDIGVVMKPPVLTIPHKRLWLPNQQAVRRAANW